MPGLICVLLALLGASGCGGSTTAVAPVRHVPLISIFEASQLFSDPAGTLAVLRRLGADAVRIDIGWGYVAPDSGSRARPPGFRGDDPASYPAGGWSQYDAIVRAAAARQITVDMTLDGPAPLWATTAGAPTRTPAYQAVWRPSATEFGAFVRAVATRYSGTYVPAGATTPLPRVSFWSVWNEPNYGQDLAPQAIDASAVEVSPMLYRGLLDAAWRALLHTGHGADTILFGEFAPRGLVNPPQLPGVRTVHLPGNFGGMVPLRFVRALYCVGSDLRPLRGAAASARGCPTDAAGSAAFQRENPALFEASGVAVHPYPQESAPSVATTGVPGSSDYADFPQLPKLERMLDTILRAYGSSRALPLYSTEYGYKTDPPLPGAASTETAALYLNWAEYISWRDPRIRSYDQYLLVDPVAGGGNFVTGLEFADGTPKATLAAYRMPLYLPVATGSSGKPLEVWGCVRPARFALLDTSRPQVVEIQFRPAGAREFSTLRRVALTDRYGYFDVEQRFSGNGSVRLRWSYPDGTTIFSRTVEVTIR